MYANFYLQEMASCLDLKEQKKILNYTKYWFFQENKFFRRKLKIRIRQ